MVEPPVPIDYRALLDGLGQGMLLFDSNGRTLTDNLAARAILGPYLMQIRTQGWPALAALLDAPRDTDVPTLPQLREQARRSPHPIRFHTYLDGVHVPCWIAGIYTAHGATMTLITLGRPDWEPLAELTSFFRDETRSSISATRGHAELIKQISQQYADRPGLDMLTRQIKGFTDIISTHMLRLLSLLDLLQRLEVLRSGNLPRRVREQRRHLNISDFVEDFVEEMADEALGDADMGGEAFRDRLSVYIPSHLVVMAAPEYLGYALHDIVRNAACYSPPDSLIALRGTPEPGGQHVRFEITDHGYGIREKEKDRVFAAFRRARQPQIIGVDGYGLSLYLCRAELETMGGQIWFESEEGSGTTFTFLLPTRATGETLT
jgi:signal transduction histidine kinase